MWKVLSMPPERDEKLPVVTEAEAALHSTGAVDAVLDQRSLGRSNWFADWSGRVARSDVYVAVTGKTSSPRKVRLVLDDWIIEDVPPRHLGAVLTGIFSGGATIRRKRKFLLFPVQVLKVSVGRARYSAARQLPPDEELSPWERALLVDGDV
jgi:hypothetical protein